MNIKNIWTEKDFETMGWHDCRIYSISLPNEKYELIFNIDYIFSWEKFSEVDSKYLVSPCKLVFFNVFNLKLSVDFENSLKTFITDLTRENKRLSPNGKLIIWDYIIELDNGGLITFSSTGFKQIVKSEPVLIETQDLEL